MAAATLPAAQAEEEVRRAAALAGLYAPRQAVTDPRFTQIARMAAALFKAPIGHVSLIDDKRQLVLASVGLDVEEIALTDSICVNVVRSRETMILEDASKDPRFANNPFVAANPGVRFYVSVPLITRDHTAIGTLCAIAMQPGQATECQIEQLEAQAKLVVSMMEADKFLLEKCHACAVAEPDDAQDWHADRLGSIVENALHEVFIFDATTLKFLNVNRGARYNLGYTMGELRQMTPLDLKPAFTPEEFFTLTAPLRNQDAPYVTFETYHRRKNGSIYPVSVRLEMNRRGSEAVFVAFIEDVSEKLERESQLREALEARQAILLSSLDGIIHFKAERDVSSDLIRGFRVIEANPVSAQIFGKSREEMIGASILDLMPRVIENGYYFKYMRVALTGESERFAASYMLADELHHYEVSAVKTSDGFTLTLSDITAMKAFEEELESQREDFRRLYRRTPALMHSVDPTGRIAEVSDRWLEVLGYKREEVVGKYSTAFLTEESKTLSLQNYYPEFWARGAITDVPMQFVGKDGTVRDMEVSAITDKGNHDFGNRSLTVLADVTERNEAAARLEALNLELEHANESLRRFAHIASHDLQEPLRKIRTFADLLREGLATGDKEDVDYALSVLIDASDRGSRLIDDLLRFSRNSSGALERKDADLGLIFGEAVAEMLVPIQESGAKITAELDNLHLVADPGFVQRLFVNLLSNAIKYRHPDRPPVLRVTVRRDCEKGVLVIAFADNGIGFEMKYAQTIFEPFRRLHGRSSTYQGTGIGLALCSVIADRHGWRLLASAEPDKGAVFTLEIPKRDVLTAWSDFCDDEGRT